MVGVTPCAIELDVLTLCLVFGYQSYKGKQKEIVEAAVRGQDVFVLAPTGMGKVGGFPGAILSDDAHDGSP